MIEDQDKLQQVQQIAQDAKNILIIQADNPDGDSLSSTLALEEILADLGKQVSMYCGVDIPDYLRYLNGWDRISKELPGNFDAAILVDAGNEVLLEQLGLTKQKAVVKAKPVVIIDHHSTKTDIAWAKVDLSQPAVSTTELIYQLATELGWQINLRAKELLAVGMLSDSLGLSSEATSSKSLRIMSELVEGGVNLAKLESARRATLKRPPELVHYKGRLLERVEYLDNDRIAIVTIPWEEIEKYSPLYNPSILVIDDMRLALNTAIAISFKLYEHGRITGKIRCNFGYPIGNKLAEEFGGGGHPYAAGFKVTDRPFEELKTAVVQRASQLLDELDEVGKKNETI